MKRRDDRDDSREVQHFPHRAGDRGLVVRAGALLGLLASGLVLMRALGGRRDARDWVRWPDGQRDVGSETGRPHRVVPPRAEEEDWPHSSVAGEEDPGASIDLEYLGSGPGTPAATAGSTSPDRHRRPA